MPKILSLEERERRRQEQNEKDRIAKKKRQNKHNYQTSKLRALQLSLYLPFESGVPEALAKACVKTGMTQQDYIRNALIEKLRRNHFLEPKEPE